MSKGARKAIVDCLIEAMHNRPDDFEIGEITMKDKKADYEYWLTFGPLCVGVYKPYSLRFGLIHGYRFLKALKDLKAHQHIQKTCEEPANAAA